MCEQEYNFFLKKNKYACIFVLLFVCFLNWAYLQTLPVANQPGRFLRFGTLVHVQLITPFQQKLSKTDCLKQSGGYV